MSGELDHLRETLVLRPGDKLLVRVSHRATVGQIHEIRELLVARLPELADVIVLNADEIAAVRP